VKKIIVHGPQSPDEGGIPSQFPIGEDVQFCQILREALDFFGIDEDIAREYFLVDHKTSNLDMQSIEKLIGAHIISLIFRNDPQSSTLRS